MFSSSQNLQFSSIHARPPQLELVNEDGCSFVHVIESGDIEHFRLLPFDKLILHKLIDIEEEPTYESGELLLLKPRGFGRLMLGRKYRDQILMEPFAKPVSMERWGIVGAILAIERPLGISSPLRVSGHVALYNAPKYYDQHIQEDYVCDPIYISELSRLLQQESPNASCVIAMQMDKLSNLLAQVPEGVLWISPSTQESVSSLAQVWQLQAKREQRRHWLRKHNNTAKHHLPLPSKEKEETIIEEFACK